MAAPDLLVETDDEPPPARRGAPLPVSATVAALWATVLSLAPLVALAALGVAGTGLGAAATVRVAVGAWMLGHGVPVGVGDDRITLVPLAITGWVAWRLGRAGVHAGRPIGAPRSASVWPAVQAGLAVAVVYAGIGAGAALLAGAVGLPVEPGRVAANFGALAAACAMTGALRHALAGRRLVRRLPRVLTDAVRAGLAAVAFLLAAGAAAGGLALGLAGKDAGAILAAYGTGLAGQAGITALCLAYLPNLAVWGAAYLVGPGFAVGSGTVVSPEDVLVGPVPALPVVAALPNGALAGVWPTLLLGAPIVAGLAAGVLLGRGRGRWPALVGSALLTGPVAGGLLQLVLLASRGALGSGRLVTLGPYDQRVAMLCAAVIGLGTLVGALARGGQRFQ